MHMWIKYILRPGGHQESALFDEHPGAMDWNRSWLMMMMMEKSIAIFAN